MNRYSDLRAVLLTLVDRCSGSRRVRLAGRAISLMLATLMLTFAPQVSYAGSATVTAQWPAGQVATQAPPIPTPAGTPQTVFNSYGPSLWNYVTYPFTVTVSGTYTATSTTQPVTNTTWFLNGLFSPGQPPSTPIGNFIVGVLSPSASAPYVTSFTSVPLTTGQQYTALVAFNTGGTSATDVSTLTISGPGCTAIGSNTCAAAVPVPAVSGWTLFLLAAILAAVGGAYLRRAHTHWHQARRSDTQ